MLDRDKDAVRADEDREILRPVEAQSHPECARNDPTSDVVGRDPGAGSVLASVPEYQRHVIPGDGPLLNAPFRMPSDEEFAGWRFRGPGSPSRREG